ncbi:MAG: metallophosphoesterase [Flavobacteriaceae bacterium]|nr:metallophosphoesterase [Flavobacteriaceae bacterium]
MKKTTYLTLVILLIASIQCDKFQYSPYEIRLSSSQKNINKKNISEILNLDNSTEQGTFKIALIADNQNYFDPLYPIISDINKQEVDFVLIAGDITEFGSNVEYQIGLDIFKKFNKPFITIIGNHDCLGTGKQIYNEMYGRKDFSFIYKRIKFIMINTNSREYQFDGTVPDLLWLKDQIYKDESSDFDKVIITSHIGIRNLNNDLDQRAFVYINDLFKDKDYILAMLHGHGHRYKEYTPFSNKNIQTLGVDDTADKYYYIITISNTGELSWVKQKA